MATKKRDYCIECSLSFAVVDQHPDYRNTCTHCVERLRPSWLGECEWCGRIIEVGERYHLRWSKMCESCAHKVYGDDADEWPYLSKFKASV